MQIKDKKRKKRDFGSSGAIGIEKPTAFALAKKICKRLAVPALIAGASYAYYKATGADYGTAMLVLSYPFGLSSKKFLSSDKPFIKTVAWYALLSLSTLLMYAMYDAAQRDRSAHQQALDSKAVDSILAGEVSPHHQTAYKSRLIGTTEKLSSDVALIKRTKDENGREFIILRYHENVRVLRNDGKVWQQLPCPEPK